MVTGFVVLRGTKTKNAARVVPLAGAGAELIGHALRHAEAQDGSSSEAGPTCAGTSSPRAAMAHADSRMVERMPPSRPLASDRWERV
jgi:hypothetical protein